MNGTRLREFNARRRLFILPEWRIVYVSVAKNACTSLKWLIAELAGEDLERLGRGGLSFNATRAGQIHDRPAWRMVTPVTEIDGGLLGSISPDNGWFVFGVVRDPRLRLFSAWQDKYLLRSPGYHRFWEGPDALPPPRTSEHVVEGFRRFVLEVASSEQHPALADGHFVTQVHALNEHLVPYSRLYDMSEIPALMADLRDHLESQGNPGHLALGRSNKSPFDPRAPLWEEEVLAAIHRLYAADFERFGDRWPTDELPTNPEPWRDEAFDHGPR